MVSTNVHWLLWPRINTFIVRCLNVPKAVIYNESTVIITPANRFLEFNPILPWAFWEQVFTGGGVNLTPPSDLGPKGADRREIFHGCETHLKSIRYNFFLLKSGLFIRVIKIDMQMRLLANHKFINIGPTNKILCLANFCYKVS